MKVILINHVKYCEFPKGIYSIESFIKYLNKNYNSFIKLKQWSEDECVAPYFIKEKQEEIYMNIACIREVSLGEIHVLSREEYDIRLEGVVKNKCVHCKSYEEDLCGDNLEGHRNNISLDGECYGFEKND